MSGQTPRAFLQLPHNIWEEGEADAAASPPNTGRDPGPTSPAYLAFLQPVQQQGEIPVSCLRSTVSWTESYQLSHVTERNWLQFLLLKGRKQCLQPSREAVKMARPIMLCKGLMAARLSSPFLSCHGECLRNSHMMFPLTYTNFPSFLTALVSLPSSRAHMSPLQRGTVWLLCLNDTLPVILSSRAIFVCFPFWGLNLWPHTYSARALLLT